MMIAKRERESKKQLNYYSMAEKVLQNAAEIFDKAKVHDKALEASDLLRSVQEERQFSLSLTDIFHFIHEFYSKMVPLSKILRFDDPRKGNDLLRNYPSSFYLLGRIEDILT